MPASSADTLADARRNTFTSFSPNPPPLFQGPTQNPVSPFSAPSLVLQLVAVSQALPFVTCHLLESPAQGFAARPSSRACRMRSPHALRSCAFGRTAREATLFLSEHRVAGARCPRVSFVAGDALSHARHLSPLHESVFPFVISQCLGGDTSRLFRYPVSPQTLPTNFSVID